MGKSLFKEPKRLDMDDRVIIERIEEGFCAGRTIAAIAYHLGVNPDALSVAIKRRPELQKRLRKLFGSSLPNKPSWRRHRGGPQKSY